MICLKENLKKNKFWLLYSLAVTYLWGLVANAYCFFDNSVSHDSLLEFNSALYGNNCKLELGRFMVLKYKDIFRIDVMSSWFIGILGLFWLGLTVFLIIRIFQVNSKILAFLIAGVLVANISVSALAATYIHDFDCNLFGILCAVSAVYLWRVYTSPGSTLLGAALIAASLGIYQSYIFVAVTLAMMVCIFDLLAGESIQEVMIKGIQAVIMLLLGGFFYFVALKAVIYLAHFTLSSGYSNSLDQALKLTPKTFGNFSLGAYRDCFARLWNAPSAYPKKVVKSATLLLFGISGFSLVFEITQKHVHKREKLLCIALVLLLPYGMNLIYVLALGDIHDLMVYAVWLFYLFALLLAESLARAWKESSFAHKLTANTGNYIKILCLFLVFILLYGNVQFANGMHLKKDIEYDAYLSLMTRVVGRMEGEPDYVPGETPVVFVGLSENLSREIPGFEQYSTVTGMWSTDVLYINQRERFQAYFSYILCTPISLVEWPLWRDISNYQEVQAMPNYPAQGCIKMVDGVLVVKLGDIES